MRVTVIGSGYVGLVTGACLSDLGFKVVCLDKDEEKIRALQEGDVPIYEPGLKELLTRNRADGRIRFTSDACEAIEHGDILFIAVGTPPAEDGSADLGHVLAVAATIGRNLKGFKLVVNKSTVPVGTADKVLRFRMSWCTGACRQMCSMWCLIRKSSKKAPPLTISCVRTALWWAWMRACTMPVAAA